MVSDSSSFKLGCRNHLKSETFCLCLCNYAVLFDEYPLGIGRKCMVTPPEALARATSNMGNRFLEPSVLTQHHQQCNSPLATFCSLTTSLLCGSASQWSCTSEVVGDLTRLKKSENFQAKLAFYAFQIFKQKITPVCPFKELPWNQKTSRMCWENYWNRQGILPFSPPSPPMALGGSE